MLRPTGKGFPESVAAEAARAPAMPARNSRRCMALSLQLKAGPVHTDLENTMDIQFTTRVFKEGRTLVAHALELDVAFCGGSNEKAVSKL